MNTINSCCQLHYMDVSMLAMGGIRFLWTDAHVSIVASQKVTLRQSDQFGFYDCFFFLLKVPLEKYSQSTEIIMWRNYLN